MGTYKYVCETCIIVVKKSLFVHPTAALDRESKAWDMGDLPLPAGNTPPGGDGWQGDPHGPQDPHLEQQQRDSNILI